MTTTLLETLTRLQAALDQLAGSLKSASAESVLDAEAPLATAVSAMGRLRRSDVADADPAEVRQAIAAVRAALSRCETLGTTAEALGRAASVDEPYSRRGLQLVPATGMRRALPAS
ncbi:MAG: hypothetical protein IT184_17450 [Acidobacteria bacterium]|nr:hypothetical protein [Acidobacteriota bacterium]